MSRTLLDDLDEGTATRLERELRTVRRRGAAVNDQETESGVTAVGVALRGGGCDSKDVAAG